MATDTIADELRSASAATWKEIVDHIDGKRVANRFVSQAMAAPFPFFDWARFRWHVSSPQKYCLSSGISPFLWRQVISLSRCLQDGGDIDA